MTEGEEELIGKVQEQTKRSALFNTAQFTRNFELAFEIMLQQKQACCRSPFSILNHRKRSSFLSRSPALN